MALPSEVEAIVDPRAVPNNRVGIHISNKEDILDARELVNSNGGEWGYVTVVIRENNRNSKEWQSFFDELRENKLIPLVRLATYGEGDYWAKPTAEDAVGWVTFLQSLRWVTTNRYIILFNEPNHAKEWGGEIRPDEYAVIAKEFSQSLRATGADYFILPAGMDDAASDTAATMSSARFFKKMYEEDHEVFSYFDGWTSHAYPNPHFNGRVTDTGPGTVRGFEAELRLVAQFGFDAKKPVFITETGWAHNQGTGNSGWLSPEQAAENLLLAFLQVWNQDQVVAVTPFILNYPMPPFDQFSWKHPDGTWLPHYEMIKQMVKTAGKPDQNHRSEYVSHYLPDELIPNKRYKFLVQFINVGQSIWEPTTHTLQVQTDLPEAELEIETVPKTLPGEIASMFVTLTLPEGVGDYRLELQMAADGVRFGQAGVSQFTVVATTNLTTRIKLWLQQLRYPNQFIIALIGLRNSSS